MILPLTTHQSLDVIALLGTGGMGAVHLARVAGRMVAVKRLHAAVAEDPAAVERLRDEARIGSYVRHPNIVEALGVVEEHEGSPALLMEWIDGVDLAAIRDALAADAGQGRRLPLDVAVAIVRDLLAGLQATHEATAHGAPLDIVHRDVSPQNLLVGFDGRSRLTDFGVATGSWRTEALQESDAITGKLGYMAPEQLEGRGDHRADLFAAGVVLWELVTGARFRDADGRGVQVLVQILQGTVVPPSEERAEAEVLDDVVLRALQRSPEDRWESAREMAAALTSAVAPASAERVAAVLRDLFGKTSAERSYACASGKSPEPRSAQRLAA